MEPLWTATEVAAYLRMSKSWVRHETAAGRLPCCRIGSAVRYLPDEIRGLALGRRPEPIRIIRPPAP